MVFTPGFLERGCCKQPGGGTQGEEFPSGNAMGLNILEVAASNPIQEHRGEPVRAMGLKTVGLRKPRGLKTKGLYTFSIIAEQ